MLWFFVYTVGEVFKKRVTFNTHIERYIKGSKITYIRFYLFCVFRYRKQERIGVSLRSRHSISKHPQDHTILQGFIRTSGPVRQNNQIKLY